MSSRAALVTLVLANLIPLIGVLGLGWSVGGVIALFWIESGIIGGYTILKILRTNDPLRWFLAPFFVMHYGTFWIIHGLFVIFLFEAWSTLPSLIIPAFGFIASHGVSFARNYLREPPNRTAHSTMWDPYSRVTLLHVTIIIGAFFIVMLGSPIWAVVFLIAIKTGGDVIGHLREHRSAHATMSDPVTSSQERKR